MRGYCDYIVDLLSGWDHITSKRMFGGYALYKQRQVFALILNDVLYFKVGNSNRADYEAAGSKPFVYEAKGKFVTVSYWEVPADLFDDTDGLAEWADKAYQIGLGEKKKPKKRRSNVSAKRRG